MLVVPETEADLREVQPDWEAQRFRWAALICRPIVLVPIVFIEHFVDLLFGAKPMHGCTAIAIIANQSINGYHFKIPFFVVLPNRASASFEVVQGPVMSIKFCEDVYERNASTVASCAIRKTS